MKYKKSTLRMQDNHTWKAPKGYKIVVMDRGAVSFNVPEKWVMHKFEPLEMYDKTPPNDNARLSVSFWRLPVGVDWSKLPLGELLLKTLVDSEKDILERGDLVVSERTDLEIVWTEHRFLDATEKREAFSRILFARGWNVQVLVTFDFWVSDAPKLLAMWNEVVRSLQLGRRIEDPTKGAVLH